MATSQSSARAPAPLVGRAPSYRFITVGAPRPGLRDLYHALLRVPWWQAIGFIVAVYLVLNAVFAGLYLAAGGIAGAEAGSFLDAFFFSVQTMGTIGYGALHPVTRLANALVVVESVVGLVVTALATGLVFVRFSQVKARVVFSRRAAIAPVDGTPTLMIRVGNGRSNFIYDARLRVTMYRTTRTAEGVTMYRSTDLPLVRDHAATLSRSFVIMHRIDATSPLWGDTPESLAAGEVELMVALSGTDDASLSAVHARCQYEHTDVAWGARLADILSETPAGDVVVDLRRFDALVPTAPTDAFPYPRWEAGG